MRKQAHEISILVEKTYLTHDSETTIYLLQVHRKSRWDRLAERLETLAQCAYPLVIRLSIALAASLLAGMILIPAVEAERGYVAYGGEYLCIGLIFWTVFKLAGALVKR